MPSKLYIQNRLYNVINRLAALDLYELISSWIGDGLLADMQKPFLPFMTSNNTGVNDEKGIFEMDRRELAACDGVVGYFDGATYDPGCGFEIGCGYAWGYPIHLITTDFFKSSVGAPGDFYHASKLAQYVSKFVAVSDMNRDVADYRQRNLDLLNRALNEFKINLIEDFGRPRPAPAPIGVLPAEYDYYLDPNFKYYESGRNLLARITAAITAAGKSYIVGDNAGDIAADLENLRKSARAVFLFDVAEPNVDSSILQGIFYGLGRELYVYASGEQRTSMLGRWVSHLNTMNYYSAAAVASSMEELIALI
jgi:nucleoside 2-deoxyribosyltransferase